jgi:hypothetical protein
MKKFIFFLSILNFFACSSKKENLASQTNLSIDTITMDISNLNELTEKIILTGSDSAYRIVSQKFSLDLNYKELLFYSQLMCNKYNNGEACYMCYEINTEKLSPDNFKTNDSLTRVLGIYYLLKANELQCESAQYDIEALFPNNQVPESQQYLCEYFGNNNSL